LREIWLRGGGMGIGIVIEIGITYWGRVVGYTWGID